MPATSWLPALARIPHGVHMRTTKKRGRRGTTPQPLLLFPFTEPRTPPVRTPIASAQKNFKGDRTVAVIAPPPPKKEFCNPRSHNILYIPLPPLGCLFSFFLSFWLRLALQKARSKRMSHTTTCRCGLLFPFAVFLVLTAQDIKGVLRALPARRPRRRRGTIDMHMHMHMHMCMHMSFI